jgi:hypothetical protein
MQTPVSRGMSWQNTSVALHVTFRIQFRKVIPIQGTSITLDSPDLLQAWLAERKKRWPTSARIEEQRTKLEEADARGQLAIHYHGFPRKRKQRDLEAGQREHCGRNKRIGGVRDEGRARRISTRHGTVNQGPAHASKSLESSVLPVRSPENHPTVPPVSALPGSDDDDGPPQLFSSKVPPPTDAFSTPPTETCKDQVSGHPETSESRTSRSLKKLRPRPPKEPYNSFLPPSDLLRNVRFMHNS